MAVSCHCRIWKLKIVVPLSKCYSRQLLCTVVADFWGALTERTWCRGQKGIQEWSDGMWSSLNAHVLSGHAGQLVPTIPPSHFCWLVTVHQGSNLIIAVRIGPMGRILVHVSGFHLSGHLFPDLMQVPCNWCRNYLRTHLICPDSGQGGHVARVSAKQAGASSGTSHPVAKHEVSTIALMLCYTKKSFFWASRLQWHSV